MSTPLQRLGRIAAVLLALAVPLGLVAFVMLPLLRHADRLDDDIRTAAELAARLQATIGARDGYALELDRIAAEVAASDRYLRAATDALAAAAMQRQVADAAQRSGASVASMQSLPSTAEAGFVRVALRAEVSGPIEALFALVYDLEASRPYLFVDSLSMRPEGPAAGPDEAPTTVPLSMSFELAGYMAPEPAR